ncbi:MAG TPA: L,D-transpeptidase family protein [Candidatus Binatia bacterium]|nr:L,D-transpeptidase family protein [Candidatus Binatia bacterium]
MHSSRNTFRGNAATAAAMVHACLLALICASMAQAQPPSSANADSSAPTAAAPGGGSATVDNEQYDKLVEAQKRYRQLAEGKSFPSVAIDGAMAPGTAYDCAKVEALRNRLKAEGFEAASSAPASSAQPAPPAGAAAATAAKTANGAKDRPAEAAPADAASHEPQAKVASASAAGECAYDDALAGAVRSFQKSRRLVADGKVGDRTLERLNESPQLMLATIDQALQRWREKAPELTGNYILVNIPAFELAVFEGRREIMRMAVVVGEPDWATPQMTESLEYLVLNPEWRIPDTIADAELKPKKKADPGYFEREGIAVAEDGNLRQKPGPRNPLGRIKFMMPNDQDIYLHDTPAKRHFASSWRALSHGCVRVEKPLELAEYLLKGDPQWTRQRLQSAIDTGKTEEVKLPEPVPCIWCTSRRRWTPKVASRSFPTSMACSAIARPHRKVPGCPKRTASCRPTPRQKGSGTSSASKRCLTPSSTRRAQTGAGRRRVEHNDACRCYPLGHAPQSSGADSSRRCPASPRRQDACAK